jgi:enolase-phosphatase E1
MVRYVYWLMDRDRKLQPLKVLQGKIWERGYAAGELHGDVYPDVRHALERWAARGVSAGIFSSGSVLAQKLLFGNSTAGDLTPLLRWHFDTEVGAKVDAASYGRIIEALRVPPQQVLFVSDLIRELDAARGASLRTALCVRAPASPPDSTEHPIIRGFDEVLA